MLRFFRIALVPLFVTVLIASARAQQPDARPLSGPPQRFSPSDVIPFDAAVTRGTLPNGLTYYVRQNGRPANRVLLRLAVKTGSLDEADDQQGLAHMLEHMAFNGSAHFAPGELIKTFESYGARLGPHVNAYTGFEETVYMLDLPSDKPEAVEKGLTALADFAGGLTLDPKEIDKERGVVIEEWRGSLGAGSRIRDKQIPVLYYHSRYAERLPIGKPDILRTFKPERLRAFYETFYRPDRMAVVAVGDMDPAKLTDAVKAAFSPLKPRGPEPPARNADVPLHDDLLVSVVTDPEATRSSATIVRKRPRQDETHVSDYRRDLVQRFFEQMLNDRFEEIARRPEAPFLGAGVYGGTLSPTVATESLGVNVPDGKIPDGLVAAAIEARRARQFGFGAAEMDRSKKWMVAFYERAYNERDKTESSSFAQEYLNHFLEKEPSPGIAYEYALVQQLLPGITAEQVSELAKTLLSDRSRVVLAVSPQKPGVAVPTEDDIRKALAGAESTALTPWTNTTANRDLIEHKPEPAAITSRKTLPEVEVTVVRFANGIEAWLRPTDFKNDQIVFTLNGKGGTSLAAPEEFPEASLASTYVNLSGAAGLKALDIEKLLAGKLVDARPFISYSTQGISGSAPPAQLETALQLLYAKFTQPGDDPQAFDLMKRQLSAAIVNRLSNPSAVFSDKLDAINTSNHYTAQPLTIDRANALDRAKMLSFYRSRFANAPDFTFFMVGAFKTEDVLPLLAQYIGTLPANPSAAPSTFRDMGIHFPGEVERATVEKGQEPRSQTVMSFFADPPIDPMEQERVSAATDVLEIALRDILREELGQTYTVSVGLSEPLPQRGAGHVAVSFGAAPENIDKMQERVLQEVRKMQADGPSEDLVNRAKETAKRNYETALKQNSYWLSRLQTVHLFDQDPALIVHRVERIDALTPASLQETFKKYLPMDRYTVVTLMPAPK
jgi:zinc protease